MLVEAAGSVGRMKGDRLLAAQHARLTRRGMSRAAVAEFAHSMLRSAYYMLPATSPTGIWSRLAGPPRRQAHTRRLVAQLERLGHTVRLDPAT